MLRSQLAKEKLKTLIAELSRTGTEKLPPERCLAEKFGYSRSTIVKVLNDLEVEGIVERKVGSGTYIRNNRSSAQINIAVVMRRSYQRSDEHFRKLLESVAACARERGINIRLFDNLRKVFSAPEKENELLKALKNKSIQGVLIISRLPLSITSSLSRLVPTVAVNNVFGDGTEVRCISCDYFRTGFLAGRYLLGQGHQKIAYVTEDKNHPESSVEFSGFQAVLETAGIHVGPEDILETKLNPELIAERTEEFFRNASYTACFIRNAAKINPLILSIKAAGTNNPLEIIAGGIYGNCTRHDWKLTLIDNKLEEMCRLGFEHLIQLILQQESTLPNLILLKPELLHTNQ